MKPGELRGHQGWERFGLYTPTLWSYGNDVGTWEVLWKDVGLVCDFAT